MSYMINMMSDGRSYVLISQIIKCYVDLQLLLHSTVSNCHRLEVSHKQKLCKVTGYKYILYFLYKQVPKKLTTLFT